MSRQQALQVGITVVLAILFLVACTSSAPAVATEAPAATSPPEQATATPEPPTATPASEPATATPAPEPPSATGDESAIDPLEVGDPERGREIFETGGGYELNAGICSNCHSLDGSVSPQINLRAPSLQGIAAIAGDRVPTLSAEEYLRQSIVDPKAYTVEDFEGHMPSSYQYILSEEDIDNLVAFMLTQEPATTTPTPEPLPATGGEAGIDPLEVGDPEWGRELFGDRHQTRCEGCHSLDGSTFRVGPSLLGISKLAGERVPGLSAVEYLRQSILDPSAYIVEGYEDSKAMPPYELVVRAEGDLKSPGTLTQEELDALVAFLLTQ